MISNVIVFGGSYINTLGVIRSLGEAGYKVYVLLEPCRLESCILRFSRYIEKIFYLSTTLEGVEILKSDCSSLGESVPVICTSDHAISVLDAHRDDLCGRFKFFSIRKKRGGINFYMDKSNTFPLAEKCGLKVIPTWQVKGGGDIPTDIVYPCFVKGDNSTRISKAAIRICNSRDELARALQSGNSYLVQEFIKKDCELNLNGFAYDEGRNVILPAVIYKERESLENQGEYMRLDPLSKYPTMNVSGIRRFIEMLGYEGPFSIEQMKCGDDYYFLEINLRNDGLNYIYTKAGINFSALWAECVGCGCLPYDIGSRCTIRTPVWAMMYGDIWNVRKGKITFLRWLKDFLFCDVHFIFNLRDPLPGAYFVWMLACRAMRKAFRIKRR